jgi:RHS repeat-associated protein
MAGGATTRYALDVAGGLPEVIVATTGAASTRYLQVQGQILAQYDSGTWGYVAPDALGSVRQLVAPAGTVSLAQSYDPFGNTLEASGPGQSGFGYTGEQQDANMGLVYLRARYYQPSTGRFLSLDLWRGEPLWPQTLNGYSYVESNPINLRDPLGLQGTPTMPDIDAWMRNGGWAVSYHPTALQRIIDYRLHIVAAATRHNFVPLSVCTATEAQLELLYTLAAIVYRESYGYDEDVASGMALVEEQAARMGFRPPKVNEEFPFIDAGEIPSVGIAQMRPNTAQELENAGFVYWPGARGTSDEDRGLRDRIYISGSHLTFQPSDESPLCPHCRRVNRLLDPVWAIEYVAANMDYAQTRDGFNRSWHHILNRPLEIWERMAAWYNGGIFATELKPKAVDYLNGTFSDKSAIRGTDLLGINAMCRGGCD